MKCLISVVCKPRCWPLHGLCSCVSEHVETTWKQRVMVMVTDYPPPMELLSKAEELRMPFSEAVKFSILGISIFLLLLALGILAWQIFRCFSHTNTTYNQHDTSEWIIKVQQGWSSDHERKALNVFNFCCSDQWSVVLKWRANTRKLLSSSKS